jgi:hypothetical protein
VVCAGLSSMAVVIRIYEDWIHSGGSDS